MAGCERIESRGSREEWGGPTRGAREHGLAQPGHEPCAMRAVPRHAVLLRRMPHALLTHAAGGGHSGSGRGTAGGWPPGRPLRQGCTPGCLARLVPPAAPPLPAPLQGPAAAGAQGERGAGGPEAARAKHQRSGPAPSVNNSGSGERAADAAPVAVGSGALGAHLTGATALLRGGRCDLSRGSAERSGAPGHPATAAGGPGEGRRAATSDAAVARNAAAAGRRTAQPGHYRDCGAASLTCRPL